MWLRFISLLILIFTTPLFAATLQVTVVDPSGKAVRAAAVIVSGPDGASKTITLNNSGKGSLDVPAGAYEVALEVAGFQPYKAKVDVGEKGAQHTVKLTLAEDQTSITVTRKISALANNDPAYLALRSAQPEAAYKVNGLALQRDVAQFEFTNGTITFLAPVMDRQVAAVFTGLGKLTLTPATPIEKAHLKRVTESEVFVEEFESALFLFTDGFAGEVKKAGTAEAAAPRAKELLETFRGRLRRQPVATDGVTLQMISGEDILNLEVELLRNLYNPKRAPQFLAFVRGKNRKDVRFLIRPGGALPFLPSPEAVALLSIDSDGKDDGILYMAHLEEELSKGGPQAGENRREVQAQHYSIETVIGGNERLTALAKVTLRSRMAGVRVIPFGLLPTLRVTRVMGAGGAEIPFVQEDRKKDGAFAVILPAALNEGEPIELTIAYEGNKVIEDHGGGNFAVGARTSWYPSVNSFLDRATYDLVFKVPKSHTLVSVGNKVREWKEEDYACSEWKAEFPLAVAGFNYGRFKMKSLDDEPTKYRVETYSTSELPGYLKEAGVTASPTAMAESAMGDTVNALRTFTHFFGPAPYGRIAITQQPQFSFGQSWPGLVYLPVSAFLDSTTRWLIMGQSTFGYTDFIQVVTPHEVAHQWWGHIVGWNSYRDQWLSEGVAEFSAFLHLQLVEKNPKKFVEFWDKHRHALLDKGKFGISPNQAGPIYMGYRVNQFKSPHAYSQLIYPKGAFVMHMLRQMMWDREKGDAYFIEMMKDFVKSNYNQNASTESFLAAASKHMRPEMNLGGDNSMMWFLSQWLLTTEVPRYDFIYQLSPGEKGSYVLTGRVHQSGVSDYFRMRVPVFVEMKGKVVKVASLPVMGSKPSPLLKMELPGKPDKVLINYFHDVLATESVSREGKVEIGPTSVSALE
jgi:hypothetical protein